MLCSRELGGSSETEILAVPFPPSLGLASLSGTNGFTVKGVALGDQWEKARDIMHKIAKATYVENKQTGELHRPHHVDLKTGMYRGRKVLEPKSEF